MDVDAQVDLREGPGTVDQDRRGALAAMLAARVAAGFERGHQAVLQRQIRVGGEAALDGVQHMRADQHVAERDVVLADAVAGVIAVLLARAGGDEPVVVDHAELAVLRVRIARDQRLHHRRRLVALRQQLQRAMAEPLVGDRHDRHRARPRRDMRHAHADRERARRRRDAEAPRFGAPPHDGEGHVALPFTAVPLCI